MRSLAPLILLMLTLVGHASEQQIQWQDRTLNGNLVHKEGHHSDQIFLLVHGTWAHYDMEIIQTLQGLLDEAGYASLAINLSLGVNNRLGFLSCDEPVSADQGEAVAEIAQWLAYLKKDWPRIVLLGHSRGGLQVTMLNQQILDQSGVTHLVLIAPMVTTEALATQSYGIRFGETLADLRVRARQAGESFLEMGMHHCDRVTVTGHSFLSYYDTGIKRNTLELVNNSRRPVFIAIGSEDDLMKEYQALRSNLTGTANIEEYYLDGADHFFRDLYADELVEQMLEWLEQ